MRGSTKWLSTVCLACGCSLFSSQQSRPPITDQGGDDPRRTSCEWPDFVRGCRDFCLGLAAVVLQCMDDSDKPADKPAPPPPPSKR